MLLLFEVSALEGWPDVMHWAMDTDFREQYVVPFRLSKGTEPGQDPNMQEHDCARGILAAIYFVLWVIIGCFVVVNLTIGIVCDTFADIKKENDGVLLMSEDAADWVKAQKQVIAMRPLRMAMPPREVWRKNFYYLVTSQKFDLFIMGVILANMSQMGFTWWEPADNWPAVGQQIQAMVDLNYLFFALYVMEMLLKWLGLGFGQYFKDNWNRFDFLIVVISALDIALSVSVESGTIPIPPAIFRMLRLARIVRIMRVIKSAKQLRTIIMTVFISLPQLTNIIILMTLLILITDILCVSLFAPVNYTPGNWDNDANRTQSASRGEVYFPDDDYYVDVGTNWGEMINRHANFANPWVGLLVLVRSTTGESFNGIMHDTFEWSWGHNRLTCCPQCGPMIDAELMADGRRIPGSSCGLPGWGVTIYLLFQASPQTPTVAASRSPQT